MNPESVQPPTDILILQLTSLIKDTKDFAAVQLPDVVNQFILQQWIGIGCGIVIPLVLGIIFLCIARSHHKKFIEETEDYRLAVFVVGYIAAAIMLVPILCYTYEALCLYFAPKAYILGELLKLYNGK